MLLERTESFSEVPRETDALLEFGESIMAAEKGMRPYPEFHHCPYIGLVGKKRTRPGCLLHPDSEGNKGIDYRGLSYYGSMTCNIYFCPSYTMLSGKGKRIILGCSPDWYSYGLVITETALVNTFLEGVSDSDNEMPDGRYTRMDHDFVAAIRDLIDLKISWQYRRQPATPANYFFKDGLYPKKDVEYRGTDLLPVSSFCETVFKELGSCFESKEDVKKAIIIVESLFTRLRKGAFEYGYS
jgi:hypothetical protein